MDVGVLTLKLEHKKVIANMVLNFGTFPKTTIQDGLAPVPKVRLDVVNLMTEKQKVKGLVPITKKYGEIMWVHLDIVEDEQWESSKPKLKGKLCNAITFVMDDDTMTTTSLSDSEKKSLP